MTDPVESSRIGLQSPLYAPASWALFAAGITTFGLLYFVQPLLPIFAESFDETPAQSSLALSATTFIMAFALFLSGSLSDRAGRKHIMVLSLFSSAFLTVAMAIMTTWEGVLITRALLGISLSGVQAVGMAYISEEFSKEAIGRSVGLFISAGAIGGLLSRVGAGLVADFFGWRAATALMGVLALGAAIYFVTYLPASRHFKRPETEKKTIAARLSPVLGDRTFLVLFAVGFLIMGSFVSLYNYIGFRLMALPFDLSHSAVSLIFAIYITGIIGAPWAGALASRSDTRLVLRGLLAAMFVGILLTLPNSLPVIIAGLALLTFGFFSAHSVASGWIGSRARSGKAMATSTYLFCYYMGSSIVGTNGGVLLSSGGWMLVALTSVLLIGIALALTIWLPMRHGTTQSPNPM